VNLLWLARSRGITQDEVIHIPAGHYHLFRRDFHINNVTPPTIKILAALPSWILTKPVLPEIQPADPNVDYETRDYQTALNFWRANHARYNTILFTSRLGAVAVTLALAFVVFSFARQLFGIRAGWLALTIFALEPTVLAHGHIVHADMIAALALVLFCYVLVKFWKQPDSKHVMWFGLVTGFALIAKFTLVALFGFFVLALVVRWRRSDKSAFKNVAVKCAAVLLCLFILNAAYFFASRSTEGEPALTNVSKSIATVVPSDYLQGFARLRRINQQGHQAFLLGRYSETGWWYYFPVAFGLKTTIAFLLLTLAATAWGIFCLFARRQWRFLPVIAGLLFYLLLLTTSRINIGVRHLLPAFPFLIILGGVFLDRLVSSQRKLALACVAIIIGLMGIEAVRSWPTYMSYMNQFAGGRPHWQYLGDSNIEWGQDTGALAAYLNAHGVNRIRGAMLCGEVALPSYGIEYINLLSGNGETAPPTEFIAIGANFLNGSLIPGNRNWFETYRNHQPEAVFGDSIYLYRVKDGP